MGKRSSAPPAPPDPYQTADAQAGMNRDTAEYNAALNRINTYTPWGSQTYNVTGTDPSTGAPIYEQNINLSDSQQQLLDLQNQQNLQLGEIGSNVMAGMNGQPVDTSGIPGVQSGFSLGGPGMQYGYNAADPRMSLNTGGLPGLQSGYQTQNLQTQLDADLPDLPGQSDLAAFRNEAEGALYDRGTRYLDRDYDRREDQMRTRLANQGIVEGSEAYSNSIDDFERGRETAYAQARDTAIAGGGAEASRMFDIGSRGRGQLYGEALSGGNFANTAIDANNRTAGNLAGFANQARGQGYGEAIGEGTFANAAASQFTNQNRDASAYANQARSQALAEALSGANLNNQARSQQLQELFALRNQPLNEFNALRSMAQVAQPQFEGTYRGGANSADLQGAIYNSYQGEMNNYNAQQASQNSLLQGLFGLGGALGGAYLGRPPGV